MLSKVGIFGNAAIDHYVSAHTVCRKEDRVDIICGRTQEPGRIFLQCFIRVSEMPASPSFPNQT